MSLTKMQTVAEMVLVFIQNKVLTRPLSVKSLKNIKTQTLPIIWKWTKSGLRQQSLALQGFELKLTFFQIGHK